MSCDNIFAEINDIQLDAASAKPHKLILLLAIAKLYESATLIENIIKYDAAVCAAFTEVFKLYARATDRNRPYTPFFHLKAFSFWCLIPNDGKNYDLAMAGTVGGPSQLIDLVKYAEVNDDFMQILISSGDNFKLQHLLIGKLTSYHKETMQGELQMNNFVSYLNSLHSIDANNKGALAESQALEPLFCEIQVSHPWVNAIYSTLVSEAGGRVILSGHAGDGKSTLAIELIKRFKNIPENKTLPEGLKKREMIQFGVNEIVIIKDLSEWRDKERNELFNELMRASSRRYLVISNTGTLLNLFTERAVTSSRTKVDIENALLTALDSTDVKKLDFGVLFDVYNLAQMDNIDLAIELFSRMIHTSAWSPCSICDCYEACPIARNHAILLRYYDHIREQIRLLYYRTYAYGQRLTMRQISAHFAYMITGGLDCSAIHQAAHCGRVLPWERFSFVNRFWGDDGWMEDTKASQLRAVRIFAEQEFNIRFSPSMEREFWQPACGAIFNFGIPEIQEGVTYLQKVARNPSTNDDKSACARRQLRRLTYFLYQPATDKVDTFHRFQTIFLNSAMILKYQSWLLKPENFRAKEIQTSLFCVLQEQFCGILPPEGAIRNWELYITLNRQNQDIRQSSQLVLRQFKFSALFDVRIDQRGLILAGKGVLDTVVLPLTLPFLDYIVGREAGAFGRGLQLSYQNRLEKLMAQLLKLLPVDHGAALRLLKQGEDGSLSTITVRKNINILEVSND